MEKEFFNIKLSGYTLEMDQVQRKKFSGGKPLKQPNTINVLLPPTTILG
jgi:hypothetical protein